MAKIYLDPNFDPDKADTYDQFRVPDSSFHSYKYDHMMRSVPKNPNHKVLEVGAGTGIYTRFLLKDFKGIVATDLGKEMCVEGKRLYPGAKWMVADNCNLPFKDKSFDGVFGVSILHHVPDVEKAFSEVARVLKPGGWFAFCEPNRFNPFTLMLQTFLREPTMTRRQMKRAAEGAGLKIIDAAEIMLTSPRAARMTDKIPGWSLVNWIVKKLHAGVSVYVAGRK